MANEFFKFKQFSVYQSRCAMKVGTDGTLLGAWANAQKADSKGSADNRLTEKVISVLDIGTGTGLIALMMAQRFPQAHILGIDIDKEACLQSQENVSRSPFSSRITISHSALQNQQGLFDAIVSNPPYFEASLECPDEQRTQARHTSSLSYRELMEHTHRLLSENGEFSLIIPAESKQHLEAEASLVGFFKVRECAVKTTPRKQPRRYLLAFRKHFSGDIEITEGIIETAPNIRSDWYQQLTDDFYL